MKTLALTLLLGIPFTVYGEPCETTTTYFSPARTWHAPSATRRRPHRAVQPRRPHVDKPGLRVEQTRVDCPPPISLSPGSIRIGDAVPYRGVPPVWGQPYPPPYATGPAPVYPGTPEWPITPGSPIYPGMAPPINVPPGDVPEPGILALMAIGLLALISTQYNRRKT
jgi:hypothetical protein